MKNEIWKDIPNYEGRYQVNNLGNVKSILKTKEKTLNGSLSKKGYIQYSLRSIDKYNVYTAHQIVAMAFLGHKPNSMELVIDHINNNKLDNRVENLQIVTNRFNTRKVQIGYTSQYKGVYWDKNANKWVAQIHANKKRKKLGYFDCELKAHYTYLQAIKELEQKKGRN